MPFKKFLEARKVGDTAIDDLLSGMTALQERLADRLAELLLTLETKGGKIIANEANVAKMGEIVNILKAEMNDPKWTAAVQAYIESFDELEGAVSSYFKTFGKVDESILNAIKTQFQTAVAVYLTTPGSFDNSLFMPLSRAIGSAVITEAVLSSSDKTAPGLLQATRDLVKGVENEGAVIRAAKGVVETTTTLYERSASQKASDDLGIEVFFYQGRNIDTTRPFPCGKWAGHAMHRKEIEELADHEWPGKVDGTNAETIFVYLGGWYGQQASCRHVLVGINIADAPKEDVERMRRKGLVK